MLKNCKVCGKEFEAAQSNYTLCSEECRKVRKREICTNYYQEHKESYRKDCKERYRDNLKPIYCKICGKPVERFIENNRLRRKYYHTDCIIAEAIKAIQRGEKCNGTSKILKIANNHGIYKNELMEYIMEDENNE